MVTGVVMVGMSAWLAGRNRGTRSISLALVITAAVFCYFFGTVAVLKFGVVYDISAWNLPLDNVRGWKMSGAGDMVLLASWYLLTVLAWRYARGLWRAA